MNETTSSDLRRRAWCQDPSKTKFSYHRVTESHYHVPQSTDHDIPKYSRTTCHASCYQTTMSVSQGQASNATTSTFLSALVANGGLFAVEVAVFLVLKQRLRKIYSPRTFLPPPEFVHLSWSVLPILCFAAVKRTPRLPNSWSRWLPALIKQPSGGIVCICISVDSFYWLISDS